MAPETYDGEQYSTLSAPSGARRVVPTTVCLSSPTTSTMQRFSNSVRTTRQLPRSNKNDIPPAAQEIASSTHYQFHLRTPEMHNEALSTSMLPSSRMIAEELHHIEVYVQEISIRIGHLQGLVGHERSKTSHATEIKRRLKTAHRGLEKFQFENCKGLGDDIQGLIRNATRQAWQSYRSMVTLEERLRNLESQESSPLLRQWNNDDSEYTEASNNTKKAQEQHGVYIPTGARKPQGCTTGRKQMLKTPLDLRQQTRKRQEPVEDMFIISSTLPTKLRSSAAAQAERRNTVDARRSVRRALAGEEHLPSSIQHLLEQIETKAFPRPRASVKLRLQHEEASHNLTLDAPEKARRGSCNGSTITNMIMCGVEDHRFVLPYFHYIKHHEVRALKTWLAERRYVKRSGVISRMEKVLHCIQLLQTGCRYETIAVIFSRSPRQIKESCHEVMTGLLQLYYDTVNTDRATDQVKDMYMPLWGLWAKYDVMKEKAAVYYGYQLTEVAKVLGALNIYIGRWRMQGGFAVDGPVFSWGWMFVVELARAKSALDSNNELGILGVDRDDDDGTSTIRPISMEVD
ncbi:Nn.00g072980.m01.CDS01 [Neocucurbitaria sp. VM-36]